MAQRRGGSKPQELTGRWFGRLVVAGRGPYTGGHATWFCICDCGERLVVQGGLLRTGHKKSCGCLNRARNAERAAAASDLTKVAARFWQFVDKNGPIPAHVPHLGACWVFTGAPSTGYGAFSFRGAPHPANRVSWFLATGEWPELWVLHKCDGGLIGCVRPDHLFLGTHDDNMADMAAKGRHAKHAGKGSVQIGA